MQFSGKAASDCDVQALIHPLTQDCKNLWFFLQLWQYRFILNLEELLHLQNSVNLPDIALQLGAAHLSLDSTLFKGVVSEMVVEKTICCILFKDSGVIDCILSCITFGVKRLILYIPKLLFSLKCEGCLQFLILKCFPAASDEEGDGAGVYFFPLGCFNTNN